MKVISDLQKAIKNPNYYNSQFVNGQDKNILFLNPELVSVTCLDEKNFNKKQVQLVIFHIEGICTISKKKTSVKLVDLSMVSLICQVKKQEQWQPLDRKIHKFRIPFTEFLQI